MPWTASGVKYETVEVIINRVRVEGAWLSNNLICLLLNIELLIDIVVIGTHWEI